MKACASVLTFFLFLIVLKAKGLRFQKLLQENDSANLQGFDNKTLFLQNDPAACNCHRTQECFINENGSPDCRCPPNKTEVEGIDIKVCIDCNCHPSQECFVNAHTLPDCRCPSGKIEKEHDGVIVCIDCNCHSSQECYLNSEGNATCRCGINKIEKVDEYGTVSCLECVCPHTYECYVDDRGETGCRCPDGKIKGRDGITSEFSCVDCNCSQTYECFLNDQRQVDCRCPEGKIEKDDNGQKFCLDCICHASQDCFLNELGFPDCRCPHGQVENEVYGIKYCIDCNCHPTQECFINERGIADCKCSSGKIEIDVNGIKICVDCDCGDGICVLDANNIKKCHCGLKQVKAIDGKCYDCDCGVGICNLNDNNKKNCLCGSGQAKGENGKCYECDCGVYGICELHASGKRCSCAPLTLELNGKCIECDCGSHGLCLFEYGRKKCVCSPYSVEIDGKCIVIESSTSTSTTSTTTNSSGLLTTILSSTIPDCYCGPNSKSCSLDWAANKNCSCYSGYSQVNGYCAECNCGPYGTCSFEFGQKKCICKPSAIEKNGLCVVIESTTSDGSTYSLLPRSTFLPSSIQDCYCGENSKFCYFNWKGDKVCDCYPGYSEDDGYCYECDCGPRGKCAFEFRQKKCNCDLYTSVKNGKCVDCNCGVNSQLCYFRRDGTKVCNCNFGYSEIGGNCEAICNDNRCVNGKCEIVENSYKCRCNEGFTGLRCEAKVGAKPYTPDLWHIIPIFFVCFTFILMLGVFCYVLCSKRPKA
ncbi:neurogenic locus Notch protein-like isoform X2 [Argiope bruennichi]|uniref:neurogenic locus Notch protein-like isoform X2 n=1 Tax=Argiope bruennichi TaxID=94029 RepID=UPI00249542BA|nr:neurogenic locus Notch protein-like isoform X2 [Argiope bruennichi]